MSCMGPLCELYCVEIRYIYMEKNCLYILRYETIWRKRYWRFTSLFVCMVMRHWVNDQFLHPSIIMTPITSAHSFFMNPLLSHNILDSTQVMIKRIHCNFYYNPNNEIIGSQRSPSHYIYSVFILLFSWNYYHWTVKNKSKVFHTAVSDRKYISVLQFSKKLSLLNVYASYFLASKFGSLFANALKTNFPFLKNWT